MPGVRYSEAYSNGREAGGTTVNAGEAMNGTLIYSSATPLRKTGHATSSKVSCLYRTEARSPRQSFRSRPIKEANLEPARSGCVHTSQRHRQSPATTTAIAIFTRTPLNKGRRSV